MQTVIDLHFKREWQRSEGRQRFQVIGNIHKALTREQEREVG